MFDLADLRHDIVASPLNREPVRGRVVETAVALPIQRNLRREPVAGGDMGPAQVIVDGQQHDLTYAAETQQVLENPIGEFDVLLGVQRLVLDQDRIRWNAAELMAL